MEAGPDYAAFFFDGKLLANYSSKDPAIPNLKYWPDPNYFVINTAIGDWGPMPTDSTVFPGRFGVEYVRVSVKRP